MGILGRVIKMNEIMEFQIYKDSAKLYEDHRKFISCFLDKCLVAGSCYQEQKAPKNAKYLAYTIRLKKHCEKEEDIHKFFRAVNFLPRLKHFIKHKQKAS